MTPATNHRPARKVRTPDGATAHLPAIELRDASAVEPHWCDCGRRIARGDALVVASRVSDSAAVFDVRWCSIDCRATRLGRAA